MLAAVSSCSKLVRQASRTRRISSFPLQKVAHSFTDETLRHTAGKSFWISFATPSRKSCMAPVTRHVYSSPLVWCTMPLVFIGSSIALPRTLDMVNFSRRLRATVCAPSQTSVSLLNVSSLSPVSGVLSYVSNALRLQNDNSEEYILRHLKVVPPRLLDRIRKLLLPR